MRPRAEEVIKRGEEKRSGSYRESVWKEKG